MSAFKKLLIELRSRPYKTKIEAEDAEKLLIRLGFYFSKKGSSHRTFKHKDYPGHINIVLGRCLKYYEIDSICDVLDFFGDKDDV